MYNDSNICTLTDTFPSPRFNPLTPSAEGRLGKPSTEAEARPHFSSLTCFTISLFGQVLGFNFPFALYLPRANAGPIPACVKLHDFAWRARGADWGRRLNHSQYVRDCFSLGVVFDLLGSRGVF